MLCKSPFVPAVGPAFGCGQCMPCRYNRRRVWMHRILLEAKCHEASAFVTLTYRPELVPADGSLCPSDLTKWLKRLRKAVEPSRIRYFAVGEYGDETERPHYHAGIFGLRSCAYGQSRYSARTIDCCYWCDLVRDTWGKGHVYLGALEPHSAGYLAHYVTKKMTFKDDERLNGRHPEFARMSRRPGIGGSAMFDVADVLMSHGYEMADVPQSLQHGLSKLPLGRYLRMKLREYIGRDGKISQEAMDELSAEMSVLRKLARNDRENPSVKAHLIARDRGRVASFESRAKLYRQRRNKL